MKYTIISIIILYLITFDIITVQSRSINHRKIGNRNDITSSQSDTQTNQYNNIKSNGGILNTRTNHNNYKNNNNNDAERDLDDIGVDLHKPPQTLYEKIYSNLNSIYQHHNLDSIVSNKGNNGDEKMFNIYNIQYQFNQFLHKLVTINSKNPKVSTQIQQDRKELKSLVKEDRENTQQQESTNNFKLGSTLDNNHIYHGNHNLDIDSNVEKKLSSYCSGVGILTYQQQLGNQCQPPQNPCHPTTMICNGVTIKVNSSTPINPNIDYNSCQLLEMKCPDDGQAYDIINFQNQYQLQQCSMNLSCSNSNYGLLSECNLEQVVCDNSTSFGTNVFAFKCINKQLVCNGVIVPQSQYSNYTTQIQNGQCIVETIPCTPVDECLDIELSCNQNNNCTLNTIQDVPCATYCMGFTNVSSCICPADYLGVSCDESNPIQCDINLVSPTPTCKNIENLLVPENCLTYKLNDQPQLQFKMNCHFATPLTDQPGYPFTYWIDMPNFKLTKPVNWNFKSDFINFYQLFSDVSTSQLSPMTKQQIMGQNVLWINSTTTLSSFNKNYFIAKRIYLESGLSTPTKNLTYSRLYIYVSDYPDNQVIIAKMATWKLVAIIVFSIASIVGLGIASFLYIRYRLRT